LPPIEAPVTINGTGDVTFKRWVNSPFLRFFYVTETGELYLNNINLENGYPPPDKVDDGGAILNLGGRVELTDCELVNNISKLGGAVYNRDGVLRIWNTTLRDNMAGECGGAIASVNGIIYTEEATFLSNQSNFHGGAICNVGAMQIENNTLFQFNTAAESGGAIYHYGESTMQITDAVFSDNTADYCGGAISDGYGSHDDHFTTIQNCLFENNIASVNGGAINVSAVRMNIHSGSQFINNQATRGGAVYSQGTDLNISTSILENNHADNSGGAVWLGRDTTATLVLDNIVNNIAEIGGGGIWNLGITIIDRTTIDQNQAVQTLAGGIHNDGNLTITYSTISNNTSARFGGGIYNDYSGNLVIFNSTISGNQSIYGSAIYNTDQVNLSHSTIAFNYAELGCAVFSDVGGAVTVKNSIIANNNGEGGNCVGAVDALGDNLDDDGTCYFSITADPKLEPLADNGGDTLTHAILFSSPAMDAITDCTDIGGSPVVDLDQRKISRPQIDACDIGAYEREALLSPILPYPYLIFQRTADCRMEPASNSGALTSFQPDDIVEVVGRNINLTWYQVAPDELEDLCWVWVGQVEFVGDLDDVEIIPSKGTVEDKDEDSEAYPLPCGGLSLVKAVCRPVAVSAGRIAKRAPIASGWMWSVNRLTVQINNKKQIVKAVE
jgi:predicted outer membrane repeat protein